MFYVVSTGRSGSTSMAACLSQHPLCTCVHEPQRIMVRLATERSHNQLDDDELRFYLKKLFPKHWGFRQYGVSDQKLSFTIPLLADNDNGAKFIWLIRDGRNVVASFFTRGAYGPGEAEDQIVNRAGHNNRYYWAKYRIQGDLCGDVEPDEWKSMSPFEKNCWYWSYTNRVIERDLRNLNDDSWMMVRLEDFADNLEAILDFLDLPYYPLKVVRANRNPHATYRHTTWNDAERAAFESWCGQEMDRWYPDRRESIQDGHPVANGNNRVTGTELLRSAGSHSQWLTAKGVAKVKRSVVGGSQ